METLRVATLGKDFASGNLVPAQNTLPVRLKTQLIEKAPGTIITSKEQNDRSSDCRGGITSIKIQSSRI